MLAAHLVESADDRTLEQAPHAFDTVSVHVAHDPFLDRVIDGLVAGVVVGDPQIGLEFVGVDGFGLVLDSAGDEVMKCFLLHIGDAFQANVALSLDGTSDNGLVARVAASTCPSPCPPTKRFIHLNNPDQRRATERVVAHGLTDAVAEMPSCAISYPKCAVELIRGHALFGFAHQVDSGKPLAQRQVGIMHDGASRDAEVIMAGAAIPLVAVFYLGHGYIATPEAKRAIRPPNGFKVLPAFVVGIESIKQRKEIHCHGSSL